MAVPIIFSPVLKQDFTLNPIQVHKRFVIGSASYATTESGFRKWEALYLGEKMKIGSSVYPTNSIDGTYQHVIWNQIDSLYYRFPYDTCATLEHANPRFTYKNLGISASILSIPQQKYGETIKPGSVEITASGNSFYLQDDGNGNLYDPSIDTGSFPANYRLVAHWNFDQLYRSFSFRNNAILNGNIPYVSKIFSTSEASRGRNFTLSSAIGQLQNTGSRNLGERLWLTLNYWNSNGNSYILTDDCRDLNFASAEDFAISFWTWASGSVAGSILSKNGTLKKNLFGDSQKYADTATIPMQGFTQSYIDESTNIYPYDIYTDASGIVHFKRSDGIEVTHLSASAFTSDKFTHIAVVKTGSSCILYVDGNLQDSAVDRTLNPINKHCLMFGARSQTSADSARLFLQDVRIYNRAFSQTEIQTLSLSQSIAYTQTAVVGNVFYKTGNIVVTHANPIYRSAFENPTIRWKSLHTIFEYEVLCRIKKGAFNLTQNPTGLQAPNSDLLLSDFTSSLRPYATQIGLYSDSGELLAVAKLGQAIQMREDVDINIIVKWDA